MIRPILAGIIGLCLLFLPACTVEDASPQLDQAARTVIAQTRAGDTEALKKGAGPEIVNAPNEILYQIVDLMPSDEPDGTVRIGYHKLTRLPDGPNEHSLTYESNWPDRVALTTVMFQQANDAAPLQLNGLNVRVATREELATLELDFFNKTWTHYAVVLGLAVSVVLMLVAFVLAIFTPGLKRRWLWCVASFGTVGKITMNWATGAVALDIINVGLINAGMGTAGSQFAPWYVKVGLPMGAIIVLTLLWRRRARPATVETQSDAAA